MKNSMKIVRNDPSSAFIQVRHRPINSFINYCQCFYDVLNIEFINVRVDD